MKTSKEKERLTPENLQALAEERLADAEALFTAKRYSGSFYICGYAVEASLKKKICELLKWDEYYTEKPCSAFKTHDFEFLLRLSGLEKEISLTEEWSIVMEWNSEIRYLFKKSTQENTRLMIDAVRSLMKKL